MIAIETDDGELFTISKGDSLFEASREEIHALLDEANVLLFVTQEKEIDKTHGHDHAC